MGIEAQQDEEQFNFGIQIKSFDGSEFIIAFNGIPGNQACTYKNHIALWDTIIPNLTTKPLKDVSIADNHEPGNVVIEYPIESMDYSLSYHNGEGYYNMCAFTSKSSPLNLAILPESVTMTIKSIDNQQVTLVYKALPCTLPADYNNWIGLWQGFVSPYNLGKTQPLCSIKIKENYTEDVVTIKGLSLKDGVGYSLIYFTGSDLKNAASLLFFTFELK